MSFSIRFDSKHLNGHGTVKAEAWYGTMIANTLMQKMKEKNKLHPHNLVTKSHRMNCSNRI